MFYTQLNNATPIETVRCGLSCFSIHFHIPKRNIKSQSTYLTPASSSASLSSFHRSPSHKSKKSLSTRFKNLLSYLWITRISIQCNSIPCLLILVFIFFISTFLYIEQYNGHYYYHQISTLSFLSQSNHSSPTLYDLHSKVNDHYPNVHVIAGPPLSKQDLGHLSWLFLHTQAVTYSEEPTEQRKKDLLQFWDSFSRLYPCGECAKHMREKLKLSPPKVENNKEYSKWLCEFHNGVTQSVNRGIGVSLKGKLMDCSDLDGLFEVWSPNEFCGCDNEFIEGVDGGENMELEHYTSNGNKHDILIGNSLQRLEYGSKKLLNG